MKKLICLILCGIMLAGTLAGCTTLAKDDKGAVIDIYLNNEIYNFDPAVGFTDAASAKVLTLVWEGLTRLDEKGNWKKALMKSYEVFENEEEGTFKVQIALNNTKWSDGRPVQADDIVYAWKRILQPEFKNEAATMLYDVKNARDVKMGDCSIDDLGVASVDTYVLEVQFENKVDIDSFFRITASPALVPLREDIVGKNADWAKKTSSMITNGPFDVKLLEYGTICRLERSSYYYLDSEKNEPLDKYVIPYRLVTNYDVGNLEAQLEAFTSGKSFYLGEIPLSAREQYKKEATVTDTLTTHTYFFNTENKLFSDARVRRALSMAIDRNEIVNLITFATPATGFVSNKVFEPDSKNLFRETADKNGVLVNSTADVDGAKALLKEAGVTRGSFTLTVRDNEVNKAIADYVAGVWKDLGFTVKVDAVKAKANTNDNAIYVDRFAEAYAAGDFDVIAMDYQALAPDAFSVLAPFAAKFSGNGVDMASENYDVQGHITGYSDSDYDAIIEKAYAAESAADKSAALHEAEAKLMEDMPAMPLVFLQDAYLSSNKLSGLSTTYFGGRDFRDVKQKNYMDYKVDASVDTAAGNLNQD